MRVTIIGATGSMSGPASPASCYLVQTEGYDPAIGAARTWNIALELGPGSFGALWRVIDPCDLDAVLISHGHADHMGDVISLQVHRRWGPASHLPPLVVMGPDGILERIRQIGGGCDDEMYDHEFDIRIFKAGRAFFIGPMSITPAPAWHPVPAFGLRIDGPADSDPTRTVSMFFTGDTDEIDTIREGATGVDLLLSEVGFTSDMEVRGIHMDGVRAGRLACQAGVGRFVATHIQPWADMGKVKRELREYWSGPLDFATSNRMFIVGE